LTCRRYLGQAEHDGQRKMFLRLAEHWPWALALAKAFTRLRQIPLPA